MRALVTGGAGFIGSHIVDALCARGDDVRVLDDLSAGTRDNLDPRADLVVGDVADEAAVARAMAGVDVVYHLGAHRAVPRSVAHPLETDLANTHGTLTILSEAARSGARRVVYASSSSVYGGAAALPTPESAPLVPRSPYAVSKLAGEQYCRVFAELYGLETVALRYFNVFGPRQRPDSAYAAVIPLFLDALENAVAPAVDGDGSQSRDFTYVSDVADATLLAGEAPASSCSGMAFNVACGTSHSLIELLDQLCAILGTSQAPVHGPVRAGDVRHTRADVRAARRALGFQAKVSFEEGLRRTVAWFAEADVHARVPGV